MKRILFTPLMVEAIMNDLKTNTRRGFKTPPSPDTEYIKRGKMRDVYPEKTYFVGYKNSHRGHDGNFCTGTLKPKYQLGEIVGVAESYYAFGYWEYGPVKAKKDKNGWNFVDRTRFTGHEYRYSDSEPMRPLIGKPLVKNPFVGYSTNLEWCKRSPLFMPTDAVRIKVQITDIKVERLLDISNEDAINEGIFPPVEDCFYDYRLRSYVAANAPNSYFSLWDSINPDNPHTNNPWVWVYHFKKV